MRGGAKESKGETIIGQKKGRGAWEGETRYCGGTGFGHVMILNCGRKTGSAVCIPKKDLPDNISEQRHLLKKREESLASRYVHGKS